MSSDTETRPASWSCKDGENDLFVPYLCSLSLSLSPFPPTQRLMNAFVKRIFTVASFEADYALVPGGVEGVPEQGMLVPDGIR